MRCVSRELGPGPPSPIWWCCGGVGVRPVIRRWGRQHYTHGTRRGKSWTNRGVVYLRVADGRIVERLTLFDGLNILRQVGATITYAACATQ